MKKGKRKKEQVEDEEMKEEVEEDRKEQVEEKNLGKNNWSEEKDIKGTVHKKTRYFRI